MSRDFYTTSNEKGYVDIKPVKNYSEINLTPLVKIIPYKDDLYVKEKYYSQKDKRYLFSIKRFKTKHDFYMYCLKYKSYISYEDYKEVFPRGEEIC